ncbi:hypothetical protein HK102_011387 [Quaeritorhiza haematococci]|nr:hypothetical protein HK102_011387 [Quaeritorhiza haematococci]
MPKARRLPTSKKSKTTKTAKESINILAHEAASALSLAADARHKPYEQHHQVATAHSGSYYASSPESLDGEVEVRSRKRKSSHPVRAVPRGDADTEPGVIFRLDTEGAGEIIGTVLRVVGSSFWPPTTKDSDSDSPTTPKKSSSSKQKKSKSRGVRFTPTSNTKNS